MFHNPQQAYESASKVSSSNRELESTALFKAARLLESCRRGWEAPERTAQMFEALRYNQRLWSLFQDELVRPDHEMIPALRANLLRLSLFVDKRTIEIMADPEPAKLQVLIDINRHLAEGLTPSPAGSQVPAPPIRD